MSMGIICVMIQTYFQLRYKFRNINDLRFIEPQNIQELRHEITVWQRAASSLSSYSKDEDLVRETLVKKVKRLQRQLKKKLSSGSVPADSYKQTLQDLQKKVNVQLSNEMIFVIFLNVDSLFSIVSNPQPYAVGQIGRYTDICYQFLFFTFRTRYSTFVAWLDGTFGCCFAIDFGRSSRHGIDISTRRMEHIIVFCCSFCAYGIIGRSWSHRLDWCTN